MPLILEDRKNPFWPRERGPILPVKHPSSAQKNLPKRRSKRAILLATTKLPEVEPPHLIEIPVFADENGLLVALQENPLPFPLLRAFAVVGGYGQIRGKHAHKRGSQVLCAVAGRVEVRTEQRSHRSTFLLESPAVCLVLPPRTWAEQRYLDDPTVLLVGCDLLFDEEDYIRDYREFVKS